MSNSIKCEYNKRFSQKDRKKLILNNIPPKIANQYDSRYSALDILKFFDDSDQNRREQSMNNNLIRKNHPLIVLQDVACIPPEIANKYAQLRDCDGHFLDALEVRELLRVNCSPSLYEQYDEHLRGMAISSLVALQCSPNVASRYPKQLKTGEIANLYEMQMLPDFWQYEDMKFVLNKIRAVNWNGYFYQQSSLFRFVARGMYGVTLARKGSDKELEKFMAEAAERIKTQEKSWTQSYVDCFIEASSKLDENVLLKIGDDIKRELRLMRQISSYHNKRTENVVNLLGTVYPPLLALRYEYIKGPTLHEVITKRHNLSFQETTKYAKDILMVIKT